MNSHTHPLESVPQFRPSHTSTGIVLFPQLDGGHHFSRRHHNYHPDHVTSDNLKEVRAVKDGRTVIRVFWRAIWYDQKEFGFAWLVKQIDEAALSAQARVVVPGNKEYRAKDSMYVRTKRVAYLLCGVHISWRWMNGIFCRGWPTHFPSGDSGETAPIALEMPPRHMQARMYEAMRHCYPSSGGRSLAQIEAAMHEAIQSSLNGDVDVDIDIAIADDLDCCAEELAAMEARDSLDECEVRVGDWEDDDEAFEELVLSLVDEDSVIVDSRLEREDDYLPWLHGGDE